MGKVHFDAPRLIEYLQYANNPLASVNGGAEYVWESNLEWLFNGLTLDNINRLFNALIQNYDIINILYSFGSAWDFLPLRLYDEVKDANIKVIKARLKKYGVVGLLNHLKKKATWEWEDGTYFISRSINEPVKRCFWHEFVLPDGKFYFGFYSYSCMFLWFIILMMALSGFGAMLKRETDFMTFVRIGVLGLFIFLLIWEGRSRYLFNFSPLFILTAVDGIAGAKGIAAKFSRTSRLKRVKA